MALAACVSCMVLHSETIVYSTSASGRLKVGQSITGNVNVQINEGPTGGGIVELYPYSTYTGRTHLKCGTLSVPTFGMRGMPDAMGKGDSVEDTLVLGAGTLHYTGKRTESDRGVLIDTGSDALPAVIRVDESLALSGTIDCASGGLLKSGPGELSVMTPFREGSNVFSKIQMTKRNGSIHFPANGDSPSSGVGGLTVADGRFVIGTSDSVTNFFMNPEGGSTYHFVGCATDVRTAAHLYIKGGCNIFGSNQSASPLNGSVYVGYNAGGSFEDADAQPSSLNVSGGLMAARNIIVGGCESEGFSRSSAVFNVSGGEVQTTYLYLSRGKGTSKVNVSGGKVSCQNLQVGAGYESTQWDDEIPAAEISVTDGGCLQFSNNNSFSYVPAGDVKAITRLRVADGGTVVFKGCALRNPTESRSTFTLDGGIIKVGTKNPVCIDSGLSMFLGRKGGAFLPADKSCDVSFDSVISPVEGAADGGMTLDGESSVYRFTAETSFAGPLVCSNGASVVFSHDLSASLLVMATGTVSAASSKVNIPALAHTVPFAAFLYDVENGAIGRIDIGDWRVPPVVNIRIVGGAIGSTYKLFSCPESCGVTADKLRLTTEHTDAAPLWSIETKDGRTAVSVTLVNGTPDPQSVEWESPDGSVHVDADFASDGEGLAFVGTPVTVAVGTGDAKLENVRVTGSLVAEVPENASLSILGLSGEIGRITKNGGGLLTLGGNTVLSALTLTKGGLAIEDGMRLELGGVELNLSQEANFMSLGEGTVLGCKRVRLKTESNAEGVSFVMDGGVLRPSYTYLFSGIPNVLVGEKGAVIDLSPDSALAECELWSSLCTADGISRDGGLRILGKNRKSELTVRSSYPISLNGGVFVSSGAVLATRMEDCNSALEKSDVTVESGGSFYVKGYNTRQCLVKTLSMGTTDGDETELWMVYNTSATGLIVAKDGFSVKGRVSVKIDVAPVTKSFAVVRAPTGTINPNLFRLSTNAKGMTADFSVRASSETGYDELWIQLTKVDPLSVTSGVLEIDPSESGTDEISINGGTLRVSASGILKNSVSGASEKALVLDAPVNVVLDGEFVNDGYFIKTGAGTACLSHPGDIKINNKKGSGSDVNTTPVIIPSSGEIISNAGLLGINVFAGSLMLATGGKIGTTGNVQVGGGKLYVDDHGKPVPARLDLVSGKLSAGVSVGTGDGDRGEHPNVYPHNSFNVYGGELDLSGDLAIGLYFDGRHSVATNEFNIYGGEVKSSRNFFVGRRRTLVSEEYPDIGQNFARLAVYGGKLALNGTLDVSYQGADAEMAFYGGESVVTGTIHVSRNARDYSTHVSFLLSGGSLAASNIMLNANFKATADMLWNGTVFKPLVGGVVKESVFSGNNAKWHINAVGAGGAVFDLSGLDEDARYRLNQALTHDESLGPQKDGGLKTVAKGGTLVLGVENSFTGPVFIEEGIVCAEVSGSVPDNSELIVNENGVFDANGLVHTVAAVSGSGGLCSNGTVRVTGDVSPGSSVEFDALLFADGARLSLPLSSDGNAYSAGMVIAKSIRAEGAVEISFAGEAVKETLPKGFSAKIGEISGGGRFPSFELDPGLMLPRNHSFALEHRSSGDGSVEVWAAVRPMGTVIVLR